MDIGKENYQAILNHSCEPILYCEVLTGQGRGPDLLCIEVNEACLDMLGLDKVAVLNRLIGKVLPEKMACDIRENLVQIVDAGIPEFSCQLEEFGVVRGVRDDGNRLILFFQTRPARLHSTVDLAVTERQRVLEALPFGVGHFDITGKIAFYNDRLRQVLPEADQELVGMNLLESVDEQLVVAVRQVLAGEVSVYKGSYKLPYGDKVVPYNITLVPLFSKRGVSGGLAILDEACDIRQAFSELKEINRRLMLALDATDTGVWEWNIGSGDQELVWDSQMERLFGFEEGEFSGTFAEFVNRVHPEDLERVHAAHNYGLRHGKYQSEYRVYKKGTTLRWVKATARVLYKNNQPHRMLGVVSDITYYKQMEKELQERVKELACYYAINEYIHQNLDSKEFCRKVLDEVIMAIQYPKIAVVNLNLAGKTYSLGNVGSDLKNAIEEQIMVKGRLHGTLTIGYTEDRPFLDPYEYNLMDNSARLIETWVERTIAQEQLAKSEERFRSLVENSSDIFVTLSDKGIHEYVAANNFNLPDDAREKIIGRPFSELIHPEDVEAVHKEFSKLTRSENLAGSAECRIRLSPGQWRWYSIRGFSYEDNGKIFVNGIVRDVHEQKQAGKVLQESEMRFRTLFDDVDSVAVQGYAVDGTVQYWNKASEELYGYTRKEALGQNVLDLMVPEKLHQLVREHFAEMARTGEPVPSSELTLVHKDGSPVVVRSNNSVISKADSTVEIFSVDIDLTEHKRFERQLEILATTDELTSLTNRRQFIKCAEHELERAKRFNHVFSLMVLDIDHFKRVNDSKGHAAGDATLQHLASVMKNSLRQVDIVGRLGGEEFAVLLPNTDLEGALVLAERLRKSIAEQAAWYNGEPIHITTSIGVSTYVNDVDFDYMLRRADEALYEAKDGGRNQVKCGR